MERLVCATWNVNHSMEEMEARIQFICDSVKSESPHVIAFQEVNVSIYDIIKRQDWYTRYKDVGADLNFLHGNGKPFVNVLLVSDSLKPYCSGNRFFKTRGHALYCDLHFDGTPLTIVATHLSSMPGQRHARMSEFREVYSMVKNADFAVVMGDFNLIGSDSLPHEEQFCDVWTRLRPKCDPGFTMDSFINSNVNHQERLDRIYLFGGLEPHSIELLGTTPVRRRPGKSHLFASDHFGLVASLNFNNM